MKEENISQEFRVKNINETRNYFLEEIKQNILKSRKHKKICTTLNYIENFLMYFNFCFCFCAWYSYRNYEFCNKIKYFCNSCRKYKPIINKKKKNYKIVLLTKFKRPIF